MRKDILEVIYKKQLILKKVMNEVVFMLIYKSRATPKRSSSIMPR